MADLTRRATARPFARMAKGSATSSQILVAPSWRVSFVTAIVLLLLAGALAVGQYQRFSTASARVEHAYNVLTAIDELQTRVVDGETALRGYLLTHDASFLGPYEGVGAQAAALGERLVALVADNPLQLERAKQLSTVVAEKIAEMTTVRATDAGGLDAGAARMAEGRGRQQMDRVRAIAADMRAAENPLLAEWARQAVLARRAGLGFGIVSIIVAAVLGLVGLSVNSTFERRRVAFEAELAGRLAAERSAASASEELLESESLNRSIIDSSGDCIALLEPDGRIASMNAHGLQMFAIDDFSAVKERPWPELWGTSGAQAGQAVSDAQAKGEGRFQGTTRNTHGRRWWDVIITPVRDGSGDITKLLCTSRDVTGHKRAEDAVRESEQQFRTLADTLPQIVWSTRADGYHDYFNERWYEYTGLPRPAEPGGERDPADSGLGWNWKDYLHRADLDVTLMTWTEALSSGRPYSVEYRVKRHDGAYRWFVVRALPFRDEAGTITRWFGTSTDIDDQKRADEERTLLLASERAARSEAERAARMKDEFVSAVSHELRTPLNAIVGWTRVLKHDQNPETLAKGLAVIDRNLRQQSQMIDDLLDVSRIISGKMRLDVQRVGLTSVIEEAVASAQPAADAKGVRLITVLGSAAFIQGDAGRLQQVVRNLVANGIKFTPKGGTVKVSLRCQHGHVHIQVSDSGQGIAPEFLQHVFQRFRQGDASITRAHGGLGVGLAIVKNLVEMHGGSVDAASDGEGKGSTFTVRLPLALAYADPQAPGGLADTLRLAPSSVGRLLSGIVALVVDDEPDSRELMQRLLEDAGARVSGAASAHEACTQLEHGFVPDIIISDIGMPELDGYDFMRRVRWMEGPVASVPAAALTALARVEDRKRALMAGYQTHLSKPVDPDELVATVASLTRRTGRLSS